MGVWPAALPASNKPPNTQRAQRGLGWQKFVAELIPFIKSFSEARRPKDEAVALLRCKIPRSIEPIFFNPRRKTNNSGMFYLLANKIGCFVILFRKCPRLLDCDKYQMREVPPEARSRREDPRKTCCISILATSYYVRGRQFIRCLKEARRKDSWSRRFNRTRVPKRKI